MYPLFQAARRELTRFSVGINVPKLYNYFFFKIRVVTPEQFIKTAPSSRIWQLPTKQSQAISVADAKASILSPPEQIDSLIEELRATKHNQLTVAAMSDEGHWYRTFAYLGTFSPRATKFRKKHGSTFIINNLPLTFGPWARHVPPVEGNSPRQTPEQVEAYARSLDPTTPILGPVELGSNVVEVSDPETSADGRQTAYVVSTVHKGGQTHMLDGHAVHGLNFMDDGRVYLYCCGVGRHGLLSVDALNVVVAPLVFFVMAKSCFWFIELQAEREEQGLPLLDLDRDPVNALKVLEDYIWKNDPWLYARRKALILLDLMSRVGRLSKIVVGANTTGRPEPRDVPKGTTPDTSNDAGIPPWLIGVVGFAIVLYLTGGTGGGDQDAEREVNDFADVFALTAGTSDPIAPIWQE